MIRKPTAQERALMLEASDLRAQLQFAREERDRYRAALERIANDEFTWMGAREIVNFVKATLRGGE